MKDSKFVPEIPSVLRMRNVKVPGAIYKASGINILGTRIKSLIFSTDVAVIRNCNAQAVMAVYPFTPQIVISQAILSVAPVPVFVGVGGGVTSGSRSVAIALQVELLGAYGVVVNAPTPNALIAEMKEVIDIPIVATVATLNDDYMGKIEAGAAILNISGGKNTPGMVQKIREDVGREFPLIATGGPTEEDILNTIAAGANAITYTPPSSADLFAGIMQNYRIDSKK